VHKACTFWTTEDFDYSASRADSGFGWLFPTNGGSGGSGGSGPDFTPQYTSNDLYLTILGVTSNVASLEIHQPPGVTEGMYNLLYTTNPATPLPWEWLLQTAPGQTNLLVTNASDPLGFYRLGPQSFWLAFPETVTNGAEALSLYITSPVDANGTVIIPNAENGPVLTVANTNSDPAVLGTYIQTNAYLDPGTYFLSGAPVSNYYVKGHYLIIFDEAFEYFGGASELVGWVLLDSVSDSVLYYGTFGTLSLNDLSWSLEADSYFSVPTSSCAIVPYIQSFSVAGGSVTNVTIPNRFMMNIEDDTPIETNTAIAVTADGPISVYAVDYDAALTTAYTVYPASLLGTNYCVMARPSLVAPDPPFAPGGISEFAIVATADNTSVSIIPSTNANLDVDGTNILLTLQAGQSYEAQSGDYLSDVTGTIITSDKPIAVFAGATDANVPNGSTGDDNPLMQQQFPVNEWGTNALDLSFAGRTGGDSYRVLPAQNATVIFTNGVPVATNDAGVPYDHIIDGGVQFIANKPIQVAHFANGSLFDLQLGDPCEILLRPPSLFLATNFIMTLANDGNTGDFRTNYMNIVVPQSAVSNVLLDNHLIGVTNFAEIGTSGYYGTRISLTTDGAHAVIGSQPLDVEAYGWGVHDAYGYFGSVGQ
jgi:IgGFc binding protein